jgi:hypothetical protein
MLNFALKVGFNLIPLTPEGFYPSRFPRKFIEFSRELQVFLTPDRDGFGLNGLAPASGVR